MDYIYKEQTLNISIDVFKGQSAVKEDFSRADLKVFLVRGVERVRIPIDTVVDNHGAITFSLTDLRPDVYGLKVIWRKGKEKAPIYAELYSIFGITEYSYEATNPSKDIVSIRVKLHSATYGSDGLDAYELAVLRGTTMATEEEWLESRGVTATVQGEGTDENSVMSQAAVTKALEYIRSVLGSAYRLCGKVDELPKIAEIGNVFFKDGHSYACVDIAKEETYDMKWRVADGTEIARELSDILKLFKVGYVDSLPLLIDGERAYFTICKEGEYYHVEKCSSSGVITDHTPVWYDGTLHYGDTQERYILKGWKDNTVEIGDAIYQDFGVLETNDYTPEAKDTQFTPTENGMLDGVDNVQEGLDKVNTETPSMELNLATATNSNADAINYNFGVLKARYNKLLEVLQLLIEKVEFHDPNGFKDITELIKDIEFNKVYSVKRVTSGGTYSETTSISGSALSGTAISGTI